MKYLLLGLSLCLFVSACQTSNPNRVKVEGDGYSVDIKSQGNYNSHPHDGNFCPPGQAKKGNC